MTDQTVWVSRAMMDTTLTEGYVTDVVEKNRNSAIEAMKLLSVGIPLPENRYPKKMYGKYRDEKKKRHPDLCMAGGFWIVSAELAEVLNQIDLGNTKLHPTELYQHDRTTPVEGTYYCLAFGEQKDCFLPDASPRAQTSEYPTPEPYWNLPFGQKDGDIAVNHSALQGVDLFMDPNLHDAFFLSDRLVVALKAAKLTKHLSLHKCRLVGTDGRREEHIMTDQTVWVSGAMMDTTLMKAFSSDVAEADEEKAVETIRLSKRGIASAQDRYPKKMWGTYPDEIKERQPDICMPGGFWIVSEEMAAVLEQFDLGKTKLYPTELFQHDRITPVDGTYFCLAFGETKDCFLPDQSSRARKIYPDKEIWKLSLAPKDNDLVLSVDALTGVDLWMDSKVWDAFFLSERLVNALKAAKLVRRLGLRKCRVHAPH